MTESYASDFFTLSQYAQEAEMGTGVPATRIFPGAMPKIASDVKPNFIEEQFNIRAKTRRVQIQETLYVNSLIAPEAGFQQLLLPLQCGLKGLAAPTETTSSQGDFPWAFTPNITAAAGENEPKSATLEFTDGVQAYEVNYCMFDKISIKGSIPQDGSAAPVSVEGSFFGRTIATTTLTASLALAPLTPMNAALARLYMDTAWAGVGGTELAGLLRGFEIQILTGVHPVFRGSANTYFAAHREGVLEASATFTIEGGTTAHALLAAHQAPTFKVFRLQIVGPRIGTGTYNTFTFDIGGHLETIAVNDSSDRGDNLATFGVKSTYDATGGKLFGVDVITSVNAV